MKKLSHINVVNALIRPDGKKKAYVHWLLILMLWVLPTKLESSKWSPAG
jgi:hypothetical protein